MPHRSSPAPFFPLPHEMFPQFLPPADNEPPPPPIVDSEDLDDPSNKLAGVAEQQVVSGIASPLTMSQGRIDEKPMILEQLDLHSGDSSYQLVSVASE